MKSARQRKPRYQVCETDRSLPTINNKVPLTLPKINNNRKKYVYYDELILSPEYIKISKTQQNKALNSSRIDSMIPSVYSKSLTNSRQKSMSLQLGSKILDIKKLAQQDRIVQKFEQNDLKYKRLASNIKKRVRYNHQNAQKQGLSLIYDKLMKLL